MNTTRILAVSLVALMTVNAARADIAATSYVDERTGTTAEMTAAFGANTTLTQAITDVRTTANAAQPNLVPNTNIKGGGTVSVTKDAGGVITITGTNHVDVDAALSDSSTNPVENKVVKSALDGKQDKLAYTPEDAANKVVEITEANKNSTTHYPSMSAMQSAISISAEGVEAQLGQLKALAYQEVVTSDLIEDEAVDSVHIKDGTIVNVDIADNAAIAQSKINGLTSALNSKAAASDLAALSNTVASNKTAAENATAAVAKDLADYEADNNAAVQSLTTTVSGLTAGENSVDTKIAAAKTELQDYADAAETDANKYTDAEIAKLSADGGAIKTLSDTVTANKATADKTQADLDTLEATVANGTTGLAATKEIADANATAISKLDDTYVSESEMTTFKTSNTTAINAAKQAGIDAVTALQNGQVATNKANIDTLTEKLNTVTTTAGNAISKPTQEPDACKDPNKKCVLTFDGTNYAWEAIGR